MRNVTPAKRFRVLSRDGGTCQYCGVKGPMAGGVAELVVDHIRPVARGGSNEESNLITACVTCNAGKRDHELHSPRLSRDPLTEEEKEKGHAWPKVKRKWPSRKISNVTRHD